MNVPRIAAVPDTNLFLHFRPLSEIDWCGFLQASAVEIKIAPVVTRELEEQKILNQSRKLRDRAATALKLLHGYLGQSQVRDCVTLEFLVNEPTVESAVARGFNLQLGDDRLVGTLLLYRDQHSDVPCRLVTSDLPLTVKATHYQIQVEPPAATFRLPSEPDVVERKNKQLEAELLRYKSREPVLDVQFGNGKGHSRFRIGRPSEAGSDSEATIQSSLSAAKAKCPLIDLRSQHDSEETRNGNSPFAEIAESIRKATEGLQVFGRQFYEDYNVRAKAYYRDYEKYLRDTVAFKTLGTTTIELNLILANTGTCPAEHVHVLLHFPDGFKLYDGGHTPEEPREPVVPSKEMNLFPNVSLLSSLPNIRVPQLCDRSAPRIRKTNSYEVTFEVENLQHGFIWTFTPLYVAFDSLESAKSFSIVYSIHAGNMIDEQTGELGVVIE
jgi:PIN domain